MNPSLKAAYIFGSVARQQTDHLSDLDVLAVVQTGGGKVEEKLISELVPLNLRKLKLSISWYGEDRLRQMFENGELFAWHLALESLPIFDPEGFLAKLGHPSNYYDAPLDVNSFLKVFSGIEEQVSASPFNATYEAGLVYVCVRNIAMSASSVLCEAPNFSRYSVFELSGVKPCPISRREFEIVMLARMAAQRGHKPPIQVSAAFVLNLVHRLVPWLEDVQSKVTEASHERWRAPQPI